MPRYDTSKQAERRNMRKKKVVKKHDTSKQAERRNMPKKKVVNKHAGK